MIFNKTYDTDRKKMSEVLKEIPELEQAPPEQTYHFNRYMKVHRNRYLETIKLIPHSANRMKVLDIGAGLGCLAVLIKRGFHYEVVGIDTEEPEIEGISKQLLARENIAYLICDVGKATLPFPSECFDIVLFCEVIEHLPIQTPIPSVLQEINRVMVGGGCLILTTPNLARIDNRILLLCGRSIHRSYREEVKVISETYAVEKSNSPSKISSRMHHREYTLDELKSLLNETGFKVDSIHMTSYTVGEWMSLIVPPFRLPARLLSLCFPRLRPNITLRARKVIGKVK